ncbi:tryptophan synthase subunit alpha [Actinomycetospora termitidis]|uniref:Tryptophan synthase alpha chain n=1 Tax=Actinomycetospora termitidis TaxID=3053470 RepID=A0ABT7MB90_9PSEU|nr:tryptophan synthase subunit alpha [Actinomycetospora sp. Odt1-22]MDL5157941.1 tryptophan synthase subunit alpha [Actinomycetospora sp. Odt1-22]
MTSTQTGLDRLREVFSTARAESRAALISYLPTGYPTIPGSRGLLTQTLDAGADLVEVGLPYSDPVLDGPVVAHAVETALRGGVRTRDTLDLVEALAARGGRAVVMTYWNPVLRYGVEAFARDLAAAGGLGLITPDLVPDEAGEWLDAADRHGIAPIFLVAPSSTEDRIASTTAATRGFVYAASTMGVTGARDTVATSAPELVARTRRHTDLPVGVGLGVRNGAQAGEIATYADGVIVGSAMVSAAEHGRAAVARLTTELAAGVRGNHTGR